MKNIILLFILIASIMSCKKDNENLITKEFIKGKWKSQLDANVVYFAGSNYDIEFFQDSFICERNYFTDQVEVNDCYPEKNKNFIAGQYYITEFYLNLEGNFVDATYKNLNTDTCRKIGKYEYSNKMKRNGDTLIVEMPFSSLVSNKKDEIKFLKE
ncbi:MAG: hypothetical protein ACPG4Y_04570 [Chitinophagales bacterium]